MTTTESRAEPLTADPTAWLRAELAELRDELARLRDELASEIRTRRLVVVDGDYSTTIKPGSVTVEKRTADGSRVDIIAASDGAEVIVAGHVGPDDDAPVSARLYAGGEGTDDVMSAFVSVGSHGVNGRGVDRSKFLGVAVQRS